MSSPKEIVTKWVDAFNQGNAELISSFYANDATNHQVAETPIVGKSSIKAMFEREFASAEMTCIIENLFEDGEWAILEWRDPLGLRGCGYWDKLSFLRMHNLPIPKQ